MKVLRELGHVASVVHGRTPLQWPMWCDRCPHVARSLGQRQNRSYEAFGVAYCRCGGLLRKVVG